MTRLNEPEGPSATSETDVNDHDTSDAATTYSIEALSDDSSLHYFQAFIDQLAEDVGFGSDGMALKNIGLEYLDHALKEFAWKLHGESSNPLQLEASVIVHQKRKRIIKLLEIEVPGFEIAESESDESESDLDVTGVPTVMPFRKPEETIMDWIGDVDSTSTTDLSQMPQYQKFIQGSSAYQWLLAKIGQHDRLSCDAPNIMLSIGSSIRDKLRGLEPLRKISRRKSSMPVEMTYSLTWDLFEIMLSARIPGAFDTALPNILSPSYLGLSDIPTTARTEEVRCQHSFNLGLLTARVTGDLCRISISGGHYLVSEIGEQLTWLASALRLVPEEYKGFVAVTPRIEKLNIQVITEDKENRVESIKGECSLDFDWQCTKAYDPSPGLCWERLFCSPILVRGYPILRRSIPRSGLEISLRTAAAITGSQQVVQWDERLLIKGFNMLMVATLAAADVMIWHLLVSENPEHRISYNDPRLDRMSIGASDETLLRRIEGKRHIIGWCAKATDWCGNLAANHDIKPAGLPKLPSSIVIDKLYLEGGSAVVGGLVMDINKKEQPLWLQREKDYPSLLNWIRIQPIVFYDVPERRAWLVDGASALLHLVRLSLYRHSNNPESPYDWVYDAGKLNDNWPGLGGRQSAINTLKNSNNRNLKVYVVERHFDASGQPIEKFATFDERVKDILHLIDVVGFDILDTIDPERFIHPRIQHINSWGHGWTDLVPSIGIITIFGGGFGDLIRADEPEAVCSSWRSVPSGKDYMAASVSTMQMLHEKRLLRMEPGLSGGEMTKKITWVSANQPFDYCKCLQGQGSGAARGIGPECCYNPVQFLAKRWWPRAIPSSLEAVNLGALEAKGAVIFGHIPIMGLKSGDKPMSKQQDGVGSGSTSSVEMAQASATGSGISESTATTIPSLGTSSREEESRDESGSRNTGSDRGKKKNKRWSRFKDLVRK